MRNEIYQGITFTHINRDTNGNHRIVVHFINLFTPNEWESITNDNIDFVESAYKSACKRAKQIGGRKYTAKQYGGGIVFQAYTAQELFEKIQAILPN